MFKDSADYMAFKKLREKYRQPDQPEPQLVYLRVDYRELSADEYHALNKVRHEKEAKTPAGVEECVKC